MSISIAAICVRGGSVGVTGKNERDFLGKSLVERAINFAQTLPQIDRVICSTDSELSSLAGSDSDGTLDCLFDMNMDEASTSFIYPVAALSTLDVCEGQAGRLEKGGDDLHSWIDILLSDE